MSDDAALTRDGFLGGRLQLWQPRHGFRSGSDAVLLAAAVPARPGQSVLDLGCGVGAASLCLMHRVPGLDAHGVELQQDYAALAVRNAAGNGLALGVTCADLRALPSTLRQRRFDHVFANPPYFRAGAHSGAADPGRAEALGGATPLADWVAAAARRLVPGGLLHVIQRSDRLPDLLAACAGRVGSVEVLPLAARPGTAPDRVILRAAKGGRAAFRLHAALILHGERGYSDAAEAVLRDAAALPWPAKI